MADETGQEAMEIERAKWFLRDMVAVAELSDEAERWPSVRNRVRRAKEYLDGRR